MEGRITIPLSYCELKSKGREAAYCYKNGSPKLKDILRMRCRSRVKENRHKLVDLFRKLPGDKFNEVLADTIREEMDMQFTMSDEVDLTIKSLEDFEDDRNEVEVRMLQHFEALLDEALLEVTLAEPPAVWCPLCQRGALASSCDRDYVCTKCGVTLPAHCCPSITALGEILKSVSREHEEDCGAPPQFLLTAPEEGSHLLALCTVCSTVNTLL